MKTVTGRVTSEKPQLLQIKLFMYIYSMAHRSTVTENRALQQKHKLTSCQIIEQDFDLMSN